MKSAYEWQKEEMDKDDGEHCTVEFVQRVQSDAIRAAWTAINNRFEELASKAGDKPTLREADICCELAGVRDFVAALDPLSDEKEK